MSQTFTSRLFKVNQGGELRVLKLLTPTGQIDEKHGASALKYFEGSGAVNLIESTDKAQLLEFIEGQSLSTLVQQGRDEDATKIISDVVGKLHAERNVDPPKNLVQLKTRFFKLLNAKDNSRLMAKIPHLDLAIQWAENILSIESEDVVLHGDIHHDNILYSQKRGWLAIDPKGIYGHRAFDLLSSFYNPVNSYGLALEEDRVLSMIQVFRDQLYHDPSFLLKFAFCYGCLSSIWSLEDGFEPGETVSIAKVIKNVHDEICE